jgi:ElaB/YqjD/DUF883 family membrane-anchored ribosome-binding protein
MNNASTERLVGDLKTVARDAEDLLKTSAGEVSEKAHEIRARLTAAMERAKETCERLEEKAAAGVKATDKAVREHPYQSIGIAFGVGLLIGVLVTRK